MGKLLRGLASGLLAMAALALGSVDTPASAAATCPNTHWSVKDGAQRFAPFAVNGAAIRSGDGQICSALGVASFSDAAVFHCKTYNGASWWVHLRDVNNGVVGWVKESDLSVTTSAVC